jgi:hypothetical protein
VLSAGAIGSPLLLRDSGVYDINPNVGMYLRAHPGVPLDVLRPGDDWGQDRGYQWNAYHQIMDSTGNAMDAVAFVSAGFMATTMWVASAFQIGLFGSPYKNVMRQWKQRAGAFIFAMKPNIVGRISGTRENPIILYPIADTTGVLEPKTLSDITAGITQVAQVYESMGAFSVFPNYTDPAQVLNQQMTLFVTTSGALHPQGTCRAGAGPSNSVVDTYGNSFDIKNLMITDASVIPNALSCNPNATIMALSSRASDYVNHEILGASSAPTAPQEVEQSRRSSTNRLVQVNEGGSPQ